MNTVRARSVDKPSKGKIVFLLPRCRHDNIRHVHKQADSLSRAGYEVVLVVKNKGVDEYLGMNVVRADVPFESILRPVLNLPALLRQALKLDADLYLLSNPDSIPLAIALKLSGHRVIYDTDEDFSRRLQIRPAVPRWAEPALAWFITMLERFLVRITDGVIVTQVQQHRDFGRNTLLQQNAPLLKGPIIELANSIDIIERSRGTRLVYAGGITDTRGILPMLRLMQSLNENHACVLDLLGDFESEELRKTAESHPGWQFVNYLGAVSHPAALAQIKHADIGLAILDRVADYPTSSITKLFEYMQFGVPFVASDFPAWRAETELGAPGFYVDPDSADDILNAALRLASDSDLRARMGRAGKYHVETEFYWGRVAQPFLKLVAGMLGDNVS